jgi:hypothetical protein
VFDATTGAAINSSLVTGLSVPMFIAVAGNDLFVTDIILGTVAEYNATTGALVNASFISGLLDPTGLTVAGGDLFVVSDGTAALGYTYGTIGEYDATTGAAVNAALVNETNPYGGPGFFGLGDPRGITVVEPVSSSSVPDTAGTLGLLALSMAGLVLLRRQRLKGVSGIAVASFAFLRSLGS